MRIFTDPDNLPAFNNPVVTVGSYDGVHRGHDAILARMKELARKTEGETVLVTFDPHPRNITGGTEPVKLLNSIDEKAILLRERGIDNFVIIPFTDSFRNQSPDEYLSEYLNKRLGTDTLLVGYNHHFGKDKKGDGDSLTALAAKYGIRSSIMPKQTVGDKKVSSTEIRKLISAGKLDKAAELLGYKYFIKARIGDDGIVVLPDRNKLLPPNGTYFVSIITENPPPASTTVEIFHNGQIEVDSTHEVCLEGDVIIVFD